MPAKVSSKTVKDRGTIIDRVYSGCQIHPSTPDRPLIDPRSKLAPMAVEAVSVPAFAVVALIQQFQQTLKQFQQLLKCVRQLLKLPQLQPKLVQLLLKLLQLVRQLPKPHQRRLKLLQLQRSAAAEFLDQFQQLPGQLQHLFSGDLTSSPPYGPLQGRRHRDPRKAEPGDDDAPPACFYLTWCWRGVQSLVESQRRRRRQRLRQAGVGFRWSVAPGGDIGGSQGALRGALIMVAWLNMLNRCRRCNLF